MIKFLARAAISSVLIYGGQSAAREPGGRGKAVQKLGGKVGITLDDSEAATVVKLNGAVMVGAGTTFALGIFPRLSALALIGSLVPTTLGGHAFWEESDPAARKGQQTQFLKNVGLIGGLLMFLSTGNPKKESAQ
ncbi:DoxX protein [Tessaracoccus bendigoensis DSM 12906]|uniref:DoxX protein n=1 Tax=Tessaracoccus bendigoensis DSM 12906 TaxID=1123357 RepID=A0A1M6KXK6_9ACTN|nr:DoxX family protein [Tessaracoccus bendigoensis]SHJ63612.1 DoxX protein [Tessaracoccus bendigoensis DSM 12906]